MRNVSGIASITSYVIENKILRLCLSQINRDDDSRTGADRLWEAVMDVGKGRNECLKEIGQKAVIQFRGWSPPQKNLKNN
jgi:hypothetical protein